MRARTVAISIAGLLTLVAAGVFLWDFAKLGRRLPPAVAPEATATLIVVEKQSRRMSLMRDGVVMKTYPIVLGGNPVGHKQQEGDGRTPECCWADGTGQMDAWR